MGKKNLDWGNLTFGYMQTSKSYVANWKNGKWDEGKLTKDHTVKINECAGVLQYAQTCFEGLKAYTTEHGDIVTFRPDLNAERMENSCRRLEMPVFPKERFIEAVLQTIEANKDWVPPYGSGATLYIRPYMFGSSSVIGVKPTDTMKMWELVESRKILPIYPIGRTMEQCIETSFVLVEQTLAENSINPNFTKTNIIL